MTEFTFSGPQPGFKDPRRRNKGIMAARRAIKREEAELRNAHTPIQNTARWRRQPPEVRSEWAQQAQNGLS